VAAAALAGLLVLLVAFALARATAPGHAAPPALRPLPAASRGLTLPHLSQATPLPALAAPAATASAARPAPLRPRKTQQPVDIVGSG
jgi:hypothetical protein